MINFNSLSSSVGPFAEMLENPLFAFSLLLLIGFFAGKLVFKLGFPKVTGYILVGVLIGPSALEIISHDMVLSFDFIRVIAIGFIGYTIGLELRFKKIRKSGKQVVIITIMQAMFAFAVVALITYFIASDYKITYGLILGAIATATAPAPIIAVVKTYRTKGPVTDILLPLVAMDDALGIILFSIALSIGTALLGASGVALNVFDILWEPFREISVSLGAGLILGLILSFLVKKFNRDDDQVLLIVILGMVVFGISVGQIFHASAILLPMTIGAVIANTLEESYEHRLMKTTDLFIAPILLAFFTIAGAELDLSILPTVGFLGFAYIIARVIGKVFGAYIGAIITKSPDAVRKFLGWTLIPQAGVAINMALAVDLKFAEMPGFEDIGKTIATVVLSATIVYEVFGLIVVKIALQKAGEIHAGDTSWEN